MIRCCLYILVMSFTVFSCTVDKEWKDSAVHNEMFDKDGNVMLHFMMHTSDMRRLIPVQLILTGMELVRCGCFALMKAGIMWGVSGLQ